MKRTIIYILIVFIGAFLSILIPNYYNKKIDYSDEIAKIVTCYYFPDDFLQQEKNGFKNKEDCQELFLALHNQFVNECLDELQLTEDEDLDRKFIEICVYHSLERSQLFLSRDFTIYLKNRE